MLNRTALTRSALRRDARLRGRFARAFVGGAVGALVFAAARAAGWFTGVTALVVVILAALVLPTSRLLVRRVAFTGLIGLGWCQVVWWWPLPFDRVTVMSSLLVGAALGWLLWQEGPRRARRAAVPRVRPVDLVPVATVLLGVYAMRDWLFHREPAAALGLLIPGWDNASHFAMFRTIWVEGQTVDTLLPPVGGDVWHFYGYPQAFHATAATLAELMWPGAASNAGASVVAFNRVTAVILILAVTTLVAALCTLPRLRRRGEIGLSLSLLVASAYFLGPGETALVYGFANFLLPCALLGAAMSVALTMSRVAQPLPLLAVCGAFVGAAHGWILLLVLAVPIGLAVVLPLRRSLWRASRRDWFISGGVVLVTAFGVLRAVEIVLSADTTADALTVPGGIWPPPLGIYLTVVFAATGLSLLALARSHDGSWRPRRTALRVGALALAVPLSLSVAAYLAVLQIGANGVVGYYFWKFLTGSELLLVVLAAVAAATLLPARRQPLTHLSAPATLTASLALALAATQVYGYAGPTAPEQALTSTDPIVGFRAWFDMAAAVNTPAAAHLLAAAAVPAASSPDAAFLGTGDIATIHPANAQQWFLGLRGHWTRGRNIQSGDLAGGQDSLESTIPVAEAWLRAHPGPLIVTPDLWSALTSDPRTAEFSERVSTW